MRGTACSSIDHTFESVYTTDKPASENVSWPKNSVQFKFPFCSNSSGSHGNEIPAKTILLNLVYVSFLFGNLQVTKCYFEGGYLDTKVYLSEKLTYGHEIDGPAIIIDKAWQVFQFELRIFYVLYKDLTRKICGGKMKTRFLNKIISIMNSKARACELAKICTEYDLFSNIAQFWWNPIALLL